MIVIRTAFFVLLLFTLRCEAANLPKPQPTAPIQAFLAWRDAIGLKDTFELAGEESQGNSYALTLNAGNLENVVGQKNAETLYTRLFVKLLTFAESKPETVELRVNVQTGDYCSEGIAQRTVKLNSKSIIIDNKTIMEPNESECLLNFDAIRRYEEATKKAINAASRGTPNPESTQTKLVMSANSIQTALTEKYSKRGASILVTGKTESWLSIVVRKLRAEVISGKKYWERLQLIVFLESAESATRVTLIIDGKYAAGLGPPDDLGYSDMEPTYTANLSDYGKALVLFVAEEK